MDTSPELGRAVLDSLSAALAVLDATGEIVSTNRTWTDLAAECTSLVRNVSGDDYLKTLSGLAGSAAAQSALAGVDSVRARKREMFRFEYAASGKWYLFQVAPVPGLPGGMLVTQQDITPQKNAEAERHASEAKYRALVESIPAGTYVASLDEVSKTLYVSPQLMPMLGYSKDAWHSDARLWTRNVHPDDRERVQAALQHALQTGEPFSAVYRFVRQDGRIVWLRDEATVVRGEAGEPLFQQGVLFDVTESRWAEEALRDREARLRLLVEQLPAVIVATDLELKLTSALGAGLRALGLHSGEAPGTSLAEYFQIDSNDSPILAAYRRALHGKSNVGDLEWHGRLYHTWVEPLRDKDGAITGTIGMAFDITESRRAEQVAAQERDFSRSLIDSSLDGIIAFDRDCRFTVWNPAMEVFLGVPARQALGAAAFDLLPFLAPSGDDALFKQALLGNSVVARDRPYTLPSGRTGFFEGHYAPLRGPQGEVTGGLAVIRDTTERKSLEAQLRESQKIEAVGRLAGGVAHDFNNLLTAITGYGQILLRELEPDDPRRRSGEKILAAADRAAALTHQLLAFSRRQVLQPRVLDPGEVVRGLEELLRRIVGEDIAVETAIEPGVGHVRADPGQIEQVILNLAVNARDAMPRGGRLVLEATSSELQAGVVLGGVEVVAGSYVVLAVRDTGHGMDGATLERVFEPFFTTKATGTGLGLATVYGIVRQSGGHVTVDSAPGAGTSFRVYLPCCGESAAASAGSLARPEPARGASGGETVLLLEDEDEVRGLVRLILQKYGYTVLEAGGIDEALRVASSHRGAVHLVLTDVIMPGLSGRDIVERLLAVRPEARVLYMSGYTDDALGPHGGLAEGVPFLSKPFTREALARKVREVLDTPLVGGRSLSDGLAGRTCLVTGGNAGIGKEIARGLLQQGARVVIACRSQERGELARAELVRETGNPALELMRVDLSSQAQVRTFVHDFRERHDALHVLVNNAGVWLQKRELSDDGIESTWATNMLGYFLLTELLLDLLVKSGSARIVSVASDLAYGLDLTDVEFERRRFAGVQAYAQSKQANRMWTWALARRLEGRGVTANALHPGGVNTALFRKAGGMLGLAASAYGAMMGRKPAEGADTAVWLASSPETAGRSGLYWADRQQRECRFREPAAEEQLWTLCERMTTR